MNLALALTVLDGLLLWALAVSRRGWWSVKVLALIIVIVVNVLAVHAYSSADGWPTRATIPEGAQFAGCVIVEPNSSTLHGGVIYIWAIPPQRHSAVGYRSAAGAPRAYAEPYSRALHQRCLTAQKQLAAGQPLGVGHLGPRSPGHYVFYHLPPAAVPQKEDSR